MTTQQDFFDALSSNRLRTLRMSIPEPFCFHVCVCRRKLAYDETLLWIIHSCSCVILLNQPCQPDDLWTIIESRVRFLGIDSSAASFFPWYVESFDNIYERNTYYAVTLVTISRKKTTYCSYESLGKCWESLRLLKLFKYCMKEK